MTAGTTSASPVGVQRRRNPARAVRALAVVGLVVDVAVHLRLAPVYDRLGTDITLGALFRVEAALAAVAALLLLLRDTRPAWLFAGLVALGGTAAVLVTTLVDVPAVGPFPDAYDPTWSFDKIVVSVAMTTTVLAWLAREGLRRSGH